MLVDLESGDDVHAIPSADDAGENRVTDSDSDDDSSLFAEEWSAEEARISVLTCMIYSDYVGITVCWTSDVATLLVDGAWFGAECNGMSFQVCGSVWLRIVGCFFWDGNIAC
ncbi:hypothetical protein Nepgr_001071 [Nepenthes gracilis]|uniref:Uncharacterized protein n=1 Tax=Nepenthes gracilis TaxID=150966 RepID=A0AAD3P4P0_NEPGR|nr:hypothetical protein Nepgr_001071 [Nepenthes gracilis]